MSKYSAFCIATSLGQANRIVDQLKFWKFSNKNIFLLCSDKSSPQGFAHKQHTKAFEVTVRRSAVGRLWGWITGIVAPAIKGTDPTMAARPVMVKLNDTAIEGVNGRLIGMGIPEIDARSYEVKIKAGNLLISVQSHNALERALAKDIFTQSGAEDIGTADEASPLRKTRNKQSLKIN